MIKVILTLFFFLSSSIVPGTLWAEDYEMGNMGEYDPVISMDEAEAVDAGEDPAKASSMGSEVWPGEEPIEAVSMEDEAVETDPEETSGEPVNQAFYAVLDGITSSVKTFTDEDGRTIYDKDGDGKKSKGDYFYENRSMKFLEDINGDGTLDVYWSVQKNRIDDQHKAIKYVWVADTDGDGQIDRVNEGVEWEMRDYVNNNSYYGNYFIFDSGQKEYIIVDADNSGDISGGDQVLYPDIEGSENHGRVKYQFIEDVDGDGNYDAVWYKDIVNSADGDPVTQKVADTNLDGTEDWYWHVETSWLGGETKKWVPTLETMTKGLMNLAQFTTQTAVNTAINLTFTTVLTGLGYSPIDTDGDGTVDSFIQIATGEKFPWPNNLTPAQNPDGTLVFETREGPLYFNPETRRFTQEQPENNGAEMEERQEEVPVEQIMGEELNLMEARTFEGMTSSTAPIEEHSTESMLPEEGPSAL
jgi:hypothetical protein